MCSALNLIPCNKRLPLKLLSPYWNALPCEPIITCVTLHTLRQSLHTYNTKLLAAVGAGCKKAISIWRHSQIRTFDVLKQSLFLACAFHVKAGHVILVRVLYSDIKRELECVQEEKMQTKAWLLTVSSSVNFCLSETWAWSRQTLM